MIKVFKAIMVRVLQHANIFFFFGGVVFIPAMIAADGTHSETRYINAKIESKMVGSVRLADLGLKPDIIFRPYAWCFRDAPAFAFVRGQKVLITTFGGSLQEIMSLDRAMNEESLECSDDGATISVFSGDHSQFFIKSGAKFGHYKTKFSSPQRAFKLGRVLSPSGTIIAAPSDITFVSGDDVLSTMRVLKIDGENFSWRDDGLLFFERATSSVRLYDRHTDRISTIATLAEPLVDKTFINLFISR
jgi:hypothetical protein